MLTVEWIDRLKKYKNKLKEYFFEPICKIEFMGYKTKEYLTYDEAIKKEFSKFDSWGEMFEYC